MRKCSLALIVMVIMVVSVSTAVWASAWGTFKGFPKARLMLDGQVAEPSSPAIVVDGTTYVPLRFVGESLGVDIGWDDSTYTVKINSAASVPQAAALRTPTQSNEKEVSDVPTWLKEIGSVTINGEKYNEGLLVTNENKFFLDTDMILENYPQVNAEELTDMEYKSYNGKKYVSRIQINDHLKQNGIQYDYEISSAQPPNDTTSGPEWLKETGPVEVGGNNYVEGVIVTQDNAFYWDINIIHENYPEAKGALDGMESRYYKDKEYINLNQFLSYLRDNGLSYEFKMFTSQPPSFKF